MSDFFHEKLLRQEQLTRLAIYILNELENSHIPIISNYELFLQVRKAYQSGKNLYLRKPTPNKADFARLRSNLINSKALYKDPDYKSHYRVRAVPDLSADEICCVADKYCYLSHLSALQRYSLTNRNPKELHLTTLATKIASEKNSKSVINDMQPEFPDREIRALLTVTRHPKKVRGRPLHVTHKTNIGAPIKVKGTKARIATIGNTFSDTLSEPELCGGMSHVVSIWKNSARDYIDQIIEAINEQEKKIVFVRAGYILNEILEIKDSRIENWVKYAQRGGSRVLDPQKPFRADHSEKWMISLNVD